MSGKDFELKLISEKDISEQLQFSAGSTLFLGKYTLKEIFLLMERLNLVKQANKFGFEELKIELEAPDDFSQRLTIYNKFKNKENLIVDLLVKKENFCPDGEQRLFFGNSRLFFLVIEWLTLQNPRSGFGRERRQLPGQNHPGLGIRRELFILFRLLARDLGVDGIVAKPQFFHNAMMYRHLFQFLHPEKEGEFRAVYEKFIDQLGFADLSWAVYHNCIKYGILKKSYVWKWDSQIFPVRQRVLRYFESPQYLEKMQESRRRWTKVLKLSRSCLEKIEEIT